MSEKQTEALRNLADPGEESRIVLLVYHKDGGQVVHLSEGDKLVMGRGGTADICIDDGSLSRKHACFEMLGREVWVEDLGSTNLTRVNGRKTTRGKVDPGSIVQLGAIAVAVQVLTDPEDPLLFGIESHDRFMTMLQEEVVRSRMFKRKVAVLMIREIKRKRNARACWYPRVQKALRQIDRIGSYGRKAALIFLPEFDLPQAEGLALSLKDNRQADEPSLVYGISIFPDHGSSAEELIEAVRLAAQKATARQPVKSTEATRLVAAKNQTSHESKSREMQEVYTIARRVASAALPVLLLGETGTGKEVMANLIHQWGERRSKPFRSINCAAIPASLLESALFGHERGAFTGAVQQQKGVFEQADGGTVLLDEVGELAPAAQAALLRVLENKTISRVGSSKELPVDTRIIAATNRNLESMCEAGAFRWDLFYRFNALTLKIPPLRERRDDIPQLTKHLLERASLANKCYVVKTHPLAMELLMDYQWPGNVRELRNVLERAVVLAESDEVQVDDLPEKVRNQAIRLLSEKREIVSVADLEGDESLKDRIEDYERDLIIAALSKHGWNQSLAAQALNIPIRTLVYKIRKHGINAKQMKVEATSRGT